MLLSIIIPIYNVEQYLDQCLKSVFNQGLEDCEVICVNDGSTDNSIRILEKYTNNPFLTCIEQENLGLSEARNTGLKHASGKYVLFVDSDDYLEPGSVIKVLDYALKHDLDMLDFTAIQFSEFGEKLWKEPFSHEYPCMDGKDYFTTYVDRYGCQPYVSAWSHLYKRDVILENSLYFIPRRYYEDLPFTLQCYVYSKKVAFLDVRVYNYRENLASITKSEPSIRQIDDLIYISQEIIRLNELFDVKAPTDNFLRALLKKIEGLRGEGKSADLKHVLEPNIFKVLKFELRSFKSKLLLTFARCDWGFHLLISVMNIKKRK